MVKDGLMIPPEVTISELSQQELMLKMIEGQIQRCLLGPRLRRMIHKVTALSGRERTAVRIGGILPHQETSGSQGCDMKEIFQAWQQIPQMPALLLIASKVTMRVKETQ